MTLLKTSWTPDREAPSGCDPHTPAWTRVELDLKQIEVVFNDERGRQCPPQLAMNNTEALPH
jgi:hypothetical protein